MSQLHPNRIFRGEAWACFVLRMWIGMRLILAGVTKFLTPNAEGGWDFSPDYAKETMEKITSTISANSPLSGGMMELYRDTLPYALIGVGCWVVVGLFSRLSLIVSGMIILSLSFGLLLIGEDVEGTFRAIEIIVIALALITVKHNILAVDNLIDLAMGGHDDEEDEPAKRKKD